VGELVVKMGGEVIVIPADQMPVRTDWPPPIDSEPITFTKGEHPADSNKRRPNIEVHETRIAEISGIVESAREDTAKDNELFEAFEQLEKERIGPGKHEEFHALLNRLEHEYLG
jgi:hypothetical protein